MNIAQNDPIVLNIHRTAGQRDQIRIALRAATTLSDRTIRQEVFAPLDAYPEDAAIILAELNRVLNTRGIQIIHQDVGHWNQGGVNLMQGGAVSTKPTFNLVRT